MSTRQRNLFSRRPRRRRWPRRLAAVALTGIAAAFAATLVLPASVLSRHPAAASGLGASLHWQSPGQLPDWAQAVVSQWIRQTPSQYRVAMADLNRDRRPELLVAPAPARPDIFIPASSLRLLWQGPAGWQMNRTPLSCRPVQLGGFMTGNWWDLPCPTESGRVVLRWTGSGYAPGKPKMDLLTQSPPPR